MSLAAADLGWMAFAAAAGMSAALLGASLAGSVTRLPVEDRQYSDIPPLAFRSMWLPVRLLSTSLGSCLPPSWLAPVSRQLLRAGLDYALTAEQFLAFTLLCALMGAFLAGLVCASGHLSPLAGMLPAAAFGAICPCLWLHDRVHERGRAVRKALPFALDLITLCVEAGLTLQSALGHAVAKGPAGPLREEMARVLRDRLAGKTRIAALRGMSERLSDPAITHLVGALIQSETLGMNLGPILRAQAEQRRMDRFARAEKLAMEAPVKMLFPLIACIFPCTFIVLGFPIAIKFLRMGL